MASPISAVYFPSPNDPPLHPESAQMRQLLQHGQTVSEVGTTLAVPEAEVLSALGLPAATTASTTATPLAGHAGAITGTAAAPTSLSIKA